MVDLCRIAVQKLRTLPGCVCMVVCGNKMPGKNQEQKEKAMKSWRDSEMLGLRIFTTNSINKDTQKRANITVIPS